MPAPIEYKTVQARILAYAQAIGWTYVPRGEAEKRRGFDHSKETPAEQAAQAAPYFNDLLDSQVRKLNLKYAEAPGALVGDLRRLHADFAGNRDFFAYLRNTRTFYDQTAGRERNLVLIDHDDPDNNVFEVTEEFYCHSGNHGGRPNIFVLIDEAHRTTGGDLVNYLVAGVPNAVLIGFGFTGTPVDLTQYGKGTFKTFGTADKDGYTHKYSIQESIEDGTTLPLYYNLAPNEMLASPELMERQKCLPHQPLKPTRYAIRALSKT